MYKNIRLTFIFSLLILIIAIMISCEAPRNGKYNKHKHVGSSSYYKRGSYGQMRSRRNVIPISKNYRIKNKRSSGNY
ncbi:MAG: hypothetical protein ACOYO1_08445 [Bacteroidales bacterium]